MPFERKPSQLAKYATNYCSQACKAADKIRNSLWSEKRINGDWLPCEWCGNQVWRTPGTRQPHTYCSRKCANSDRTTRGNVKPNMLGEKNPNWLGGKSQLPYAWGFNASLKRFIRARDGHTCRHCGVKPSLSRDLVIHHVDKSKDNHHPSNLILLCRPCHIVVHPPPQHGTAQSVTLP